MARCPCPGTPCGFRRCARICAPSRVGPGHRARRGGQLAGQAGGPCLSRSPQTLQAVTKSLSSMFMWCVSRCTKTLGLLMSFTSSMAWRHGRLSCQGRIHSSAAVLASSRAHLHARVGDVGLVPVDHLQAVLDAVVCRHVRHFLPVQSGQPALLQARA